MKHLRKTLFLFVIITLISSSIPFQMFAAEESNIEGFDKKQTTIVINESEQDIEMVSLFKSDSIESEVLITLKHGTVITLIEQNEDFSLVEFVSDDGEASEPFIGYVLNEYIKLIDEAANENSSPEETQEKNEEAVAEEEEIDEGVSEQPLTDSEEAAEQEQQANMNLMSVNETALNGSALKNPTHVYADQSRNSTILRTYAQGTILKYYELNDQWYRATVKYKGEWTAGYIHKSDVGDPASSGIILEGIALKNPTLVYEETSTRSKALRNYAEGTILKYQLFNDDWYIARIKYEGEWTTGYIHKSDVENILDEEKPLEGIAQKNPTYVYERASTKSKAIRNYAEGSVLKYRTFSSNWYIARVKYKGKWTSGYIHKSDVENTITNQESLSGIGLKQPTNIYSRASTKSSVHKSYSQGTILKYKSLSKNWYEAIVYVKGKRRVGYIHKNDVEQIVSKQEQVEAWALKTPTNVYDRASRSGKILRNNYKKGKLLKVRTLSNNWYEATVSYRGKWVTGYIHAKDISLLNAKYIDYNLSLKDAVEIQLKGSPQTDKKYAWVSKSYINNNLVTTPELNVRLGPGTNYKSVDIINEGTEVKILDEYNGWYVIEFNHSSQWTHASPKDVLAHLNPQNYINNEQLKFQFLDLSRRSGASTSVLNKYLNGKGTLSGQGNAFVDAAKKYGLNDIYLISHAILETGHGTSRLAQGLQVGLDKDNKPQLVTSKNEKELTQIKTVYNMFGIRAFDTCPESCGAAYAYNEGWDTPYKAIVGGAEFIGSDYILGQSSEGTVLNTLYKMRWNPEFAAKNGRFGKQYATDIGWAVKQARLMYNLYQEIGEHKLVLDIPVYLR